MTRRVHEGRQVAATPGAQEEGQKTVEPVPARGVRVAGQVRDSEVIEVERIAGVLEVTSWIKRLFHPPR